mgnify:FL=1
MNQSESYVFDILKKYSKGGEWKFFEVFDEKGKTKPQSKNYGSGFVAYPDFEFYSDKKLMLLVEVKGYNGYFEDRDSTVAMKYRVYKGYKQVRVNENVDVRICFSIKFSNGEIVLFWETLDNIIKFPKYVQKHYYREFDYHSGQVVEKCEDYIYWKVEDFRTDHKNLPIVSQ